MKKTMSILICVLMLVPFATMAFAENVTTLTTTVPGAAYTLNIPADQTIDYGATSTSLGKVTVTGSSGFAVDKNLYVTATYGDFTCTNTDTVIPFELKSCVGVHYAVWESGKDITFLGQADGTVETNAQFIGCEHGGVNGYTSDDYCIDIASEDWGKAVPGTYTATINFTAEVKNA
ncbi:MAG: hypothetical protein IKB36_00605 [Clostridia bacterium]|nr:hypothetical protein [Clostridia bacterium]